MNIFLSLFRYTWNSCEDRINKRKTSGYLVSRTFLGAPWGLGLVGTWWLSLETRPSLKPDSVSWMGPHWAGKATGSVKRGKDSQNNRRRKWSQKNKRRRKSSNELQKNQRGKENPREAEKVKQQKSRGENAACWLRSRGPGLCILFLPFSEEGHGLTMIQWIWMRLPSFLFS